MLVTPFRLYQLPQPYRSRVGRITTFVPEGICEEGLAWLRGQGAYRREVEAFLRYVDELNDEDVKTPYLPESDLVEIRTEDDPVRHSKASLRRRFHFFDDFFSEFPDEVPHVPYPNAIVARALYCNSIMMDCLGCMRFLNPKDNLEYLYFDTYSTDTETLLSLVKQLTEKEKMDILEARRWRRPDLPLPYEGTDLAILAIVLEYHCDYNMSKKLFSEYPSYLYSICDNVEENRALLLAADFSREWRDKKTSVCQDVLRLLTQAKTQEEAKRLLAMLGIVSPMFKNEDIFAVLPYNEPPCLQYLSTYFDDIVNNLSILYGLERDVIAEQLKKFE